MNWSSYVQTLTAGETQSQSAERTGVDQTTISRWKRGDATPANAAAVAHFAQCYNANVLEAFVAAGFITEEEAGIPPQPKIDFYWIVERDPSLSDQAKIHLKNQYGLLRSASVVDRTTAIRDAIMEDPDLDETTRQRLVAQFEAHGVMTAYTSSVTVVENPFPRVDTAFATALSVAADTTGVAIAADEHGDWAGEQESHNEP